MKIKLLSSEERIALDEEIIVGIKVGEDAVARNGVRASTIAHEILTDYRVEIGHFLDRFFYVERTFAL